MKSPVQSLPPALKPGSGWPWEGDFLPEPSQDQDQSLPLLTVVVPTFNQGQYIEESLLSVFKQNYPRVELLIYDGGSQDQTVEILKKYDPWIDFWVSQKDGGQTSAIKAGFARAKGDWVAWLNSDDVYLPGLFNKIVATAQAHPEAEVIFGNKDSYNGDGTFRQSFISAVPSFNNMVPWQSIFSETTFFSRESVLNSVHLDETFQHYMDYDFFWRLLLAGKKFVKAEGANARWRVHAECKSIRGKERADEERFEVIYRALRSGQVPLAHRQALMDHLVAECRNAFGARRLKLFRGQWSRICRWKGIRRKPGLWVRYLLSWLMWWSRPRQDKLDLYLTNLPPHIA